MKSIHREIVSALIISEDGKICLGMKYANGGGVYQNCWHLPGGGVDEEEDLVRALIREVKEETGLDISSDEMKKIDHHDEGESKKVLKSGETVLCKMNFHVFEIHLNQNSDEIKFRSGDDLEKIKWFSKEKISDLKLTPPSAKLFTKLKFCK